MDKAPTQITSLLQDLSDSLPTLLEDNLVGLYLYGSLTQGAFNPGNSDVDCIAVIQRELTDRQFSELDAWLARAVAANPWFARLQMSIMIRDEILINTAKGNCLYQFGRLTRVGSDGNPIIWMNVIESGVTLFGPPPETFVPAITSEVLFAALVREVDYLREEMVRAPSSEWRDDPKYHSYAVLTLCRILYSHTFGTVVSKPKAAEWALRNLPAKWHNIIAQALEYDTGISGDAIDLAAIARFIEFADAQLHART